MLASTFYLIIGLVAGGGLTAVIGGTVIASMTKEKRTKKREYNKYAPARVRNLPKEIEEELNGLREDLGKLLELDQYKTATALSSVIELAQELFGKLTRRGDTHQVNMAAVSYGHLFAKLNKALSEEYFFDMLQNPAMWTRVDERTLAVRNAVKAVNAELLEAIRNFNSHADMEFEVDMEAILRKTNSDGILKDLG